MPDIRLIAPLKFVSWQSSLLQDFADADLDDVAALRRMQRRARRLLSVTSVGGSFTAPGTFPECCLIVNGPTKASGVCLGDRLVLTAAHIPFQPIQSLRVFAPLEFLGQPNLPTPSAVAEVVRRADAAGGGGHNDLALLRLATSLTIPAPLRLADQTLFDAAKSTGAPLTLCGFGESDQTPSGAKRVSSAPGFIRTDAELTALAGERGMAGFNGGFEFVAFGRQRGRLVDACHGDSGGPVYVNDGPNRVIFGIESRGVDPDASCGDDEKGSVFTRIDAHLAWIDAHRV